MRMEKKKCLMIFIEDTDTWKGQRLYEVIVRLMHKRGKGHAAIVAVEQPGQRSGKDSIDREDLVAGVQQVAQRADDRQARADRRFVAES